MRSKSRSTRSDSQRFAAPHWFTRLCGLLLQCIALILGGLALLAGSFAAAIVFDSPVVFLLLGALAACVVAFLLSLLALRLLGVSKRSAWASLIAAANTVIAFGGFSYLFLTPLIPKDEQFVAQVPDDVEQWTLSTSSTIAVRKIARRGEQARNPIVFLHGGPGAYSVSLDLTVDAISPLRDNGHDVYFYDQVGGGLSARLADISDYTIDRHIDDLEAIYQRVGSAKMILIGSSGGAALGANYMAKYPGHVAAAIFSGAAPIYHPQWPDGSDGGLDERLSAAQRAAFEDMVETPRLFAALALAEVNPKAAVNFASEAELGSLFDRVANEFYLSHAVCDAAGLKVRSSGYGFWSNRMTGKSLHNRKTDPRPVLRENDTPVLILRGECDYKSAAVAKEYVDVFPNARFSDFERAGHMLYWEQPDAYLLRVRQFLAEVFD